MFDKSQRADGTFAQEHLTYGPERDIYVCPWGNELTTLVNEGATPFYRASKADCYACGLKHTDVARGT